MPVQGKSIPRHGSTADYGANVEASFNFGSVLKTLAPIASAALGAI